MYELCFGVVWVINSPYISRNIEKRIHFLFVLGLRERESIINFGVFLS